MTTILFFVSLLGIAFMLGSKVFEIKVRRINMLVKFFSKGDVKIHQFIDWMIFKYGRYRKITSIFIFDFLPAYAY